ncbi:hypothetical protein PBRA_001672 [Plasmodiophora brassicae]|uniref:Uncharacterized protein n=1 Tax=Plasmodiophora brassicae TaxID=37360 RepID=A0A0G4IZ74_PLABS|nr:hypothetical protein PBRA_001672 [Plasmodiophora brassicae]
MGLGDDGPPAERSVAQMEGSPWVGGAAGVVDTDGSARSSGRCIVKGDVESPSNGGAYEEGAPVDLAIVEHDMNPALLSAFTALFVELVHTRKAYPSAEVLADQLQSSPKLLQGWNVIRTTDSEVWTHMSAIDAGTFIRFRAGPDQTFTYIVFRVQRQ